MTSKPNLVHVLVFIVIIILVTFTTLLAYNKYRNTNTSTSPVNIANQESQDKGTDWKNYSDELYEFQYPNNWIAQVKQDEYFGHHAIITNPQSTVELNVLTGQQPFGFAGDVKEETNELDLVIEGKKYEVKEHILEDSRSVYINYVYNKSGSRYQILFGTGYPTSGDANFSLDDYLRYKETIIKILSTFEFKQEIVPLEPTDTPLSQSYTDPDYGYTVYYSNDWIFRKTYGPEIPKANPNEPIKSGVDLHLGGSVETAAANIGINVLEAHGSTNVNEWIAQYDSNYPKTGTRENVIFNEYPAVRFSFNRPEDPNKRSEYVYLIKNAMVYRIMYWEIGEISKETREVVNSIKP